MKILSEIIVETRPTLQTRAYTIYTTYQTIDIPVATLITPALELAPGKEEQFREQFDAKKGALYEKWLAERAKRLKADIEQRRGRRPEIVRV